MKKLLLLVSALVLGLSLAACGGATTIPTDPTDPVDPGEVCTNRASEGTLYKFDENQTEITEIKVWLDDDAYANALIEAFEAKYENIKVEYENVGSVDTRQRLETFSGSEFAADVVVFPHDHIGAALNSNLLYPFPQSQRDDLDERMVSSAIATATSCYDSTNNEAVACDGVATSELFGAPLSGESIALFYNKTLLNEIDSSKTYPEATFEEIIASALAWNAIDDASTPDVNEEQTYIRMDVGNAYDMHFAATAFGFELFGADHLDETSANLDSTEMVNALTWLNETLRPAMNNFNATTLSGDNNATAFENGELPYMITGPWNIQRFLEASVDDNGTPDDTSDDTQLFEFGVSRIPTIGGENPVTFSGVQIAAVYKGTSQPTAAFKFVEFMTSEEGLAIMYAQTGKLPALKDVSVVEGVAADEYLSGISAQLAYSHPMPIIPEMGYFWSNAASMYSSAWNGTATPTDAATEAQNGFEAQSGITG